MPPFKSKSGDADFDRVFNGEEGMRQQLLDELMQISEEESKYKAGQAAIEEQLYSEASIQEIDRQKLLRRGKLITVRRHSRFVEFPLHRHNYVEFMYVVQGEITHVIDGKELTLYKGDLLMPISMWNMRFTELNLKTLESILLLCRNFLKFRLECFRKKMF